MGLQGPLRWHPWAPPCMVRSLWGAPLDVATARGEVLRSPSHFAGPLPSPGLHLCKSPLASRGSRAADQRCVSLAAFVALGLGVQLGVQSIPRQPGDTARSLSERRGSVLCLPAAWPLLPVQLLPASRSLTAVPGDQEKFVTVLSVTARPSGVSGCPLAGCFC